jgi:hypothetical protein
VAKNRQSKKQAAKSAEPVVAGGSRTLWIIVVAIVVVAIGAWAWTSTSKKSASSAVAASPEEQKYIGRLLPAGYQEAKVADVQAYASTVKMTNVAAAQSADAVTLPLDQVVASKIVSFSYKKPSGEVVPMLAYLKPSGKLFVGVDYCPPCKGVGQRIESGGTLVCETCGTVRNLESGVGISGACKLYPIDEVPASVSGGKVVVSAAAINGWSQQPLDRPTGS